jgi:hypothetical protein
MENSRLVYLRDTTVQKVIIDWIPNTYTYTFQVIAEPGDKYKENPVNWLERKKIAKERIYAISPDYNHGVYTRKQVIEKFKFDPENYQGKTVRVTVNFSVDYKIKDFPNLDEAKVWIKKLCPDFDKFTLIDVL